MFQEQAIRSTGSSGIGSGKNYDSVSNNDRDGYGQPDGKKRLIYFYFHYFHIEKHLSLMYFIYLCISIQKD